MDHFFQIDGLGPFEAEMLESYTTLSFLAAVSSRARLGTLVTGVTYRNPAVLVKQVTSIENWRALGTAGAGFTAFTRWIAAKSISGSVLSEETSSGVVMRLPASAGR